MSINKRQIYLPLIISLILIIGILIGSYLGNPFSSANKSLQGNEIKNDKIHEIINYVNQAYVDSTNSKELEEKAIKGLLQSLDPHSEYIPPTIYNEMNDQLMGKFEGIGVQFRLEKDTIFVVNTISGGPSEKVGLRAGDRIINIDGKKYVGKKVTNEIVMKNLKGNKGTKVKVGILRRGFKSLIDFTITRDVIPTISVDASYILANHIGYIKISKFSATTATEFDKALKKLMGEGMKKLIVDLRGNGGGYLEAAIKVADELLPKDKLIVYTQGVHNPRKQVFATGDGIFETQPLVILIDDWSASASEIVSGAIQDNDRGLIIGRRSFGKGLVQEQLRFKDGSAMRLTVARYYTPTGRCIQKPYTNGVDDYYDKFYERFVNGEMQNPDSIHYKNAHKFKTSKGKVVYGDGGIMPDIYVPVKKDEYPDFYTKVFNKGLIYQFAFDYLDKNRPEFIKYKSFAEYNNRFTPDDKILKDFENYSFKNGIKKDVKGINESAKFIRIQLKASIARNIFNEEAYLEILNSIDNIVVKAKEELQKK